MKRIALMLLALGALPLAAQTQAPARKEGGTRVDINARDISTTASEGNTASVTVGGIGNDADVEGVTVINGKVWIDGREVPAAAKRYKSKSGTVYRIERSKSGAVSVTSE